MQIKNKILLTCKALCGVKFMCIQIILNWVFISSLIACIPSNGNVPEKLTQIFLTTITAEPVVATQGVDSATFTPSQLTLTVQTENSPNKGSLSGYESIVAIQNRFPEVASIRPLLTPEPIKPDHVVIYELDGKWDIIFITGSGDCPSGCLNNYFWYFSAWPNGKIIKVGEFSRVFDSKTNSFIEKGIPYWGVPK